MTHINAVGLQSGLDVKRNEHLSKVRLGLLNYPLRLGPVQTEDVARAALKTATTISELVT